MKIELNKEVTPPKPETDWFKLRDGSAIYHRGQNGFCIDLRNGSISPAKYVDGLYTIFDESERYEPLYPGTQITITL